LADVILEMYVLEYMMLCHNRNIGELAMTICPLATKFLNPVFNMNEGWDYLFTSAKLQLQALITPADIYYNSCGNSVCNDIAGSGDLFSFTLILWIAWGGLLRDTFLLNLSLQCIRRVLQQ
jgi:hypothetical protein